MGTIASQKHFRNNSKLHAHIFMWQRINWAESTDSTQSKNYQHEDSDILTINDSSEDGEWGETGTSGRDVCPSSSSKSFLNYEMSII